MGRKQNRYPPFVMMERPTLESAEWKQLSHSEMISYLYIKKNFNGRNNGKIPMKYLETKDIFAPATFAKALKGLVRKGWVEKTDYGGLHRHYSLFKLTGKYDKIRFARGYGNS